MGTKQFDGVRAASGSTIEIDFYYKNIRCRERIKLQPTPANLKRAFRHRAAILDAIEAGTFDYPTTFPNSKNASKFHGPGSDTTLATYLATWLTMKEPTLKASTLADYTKIINNQIVPVLGGIGITELTRAQVRDWVAAMTCSRKRIANLVSPLRAALDDAVHDDYIQVNPIAGWSYKKTEPPKDTHVDPFTREEQQAILAATRGQFHNLVEFALWSGLRTSELIALQWSDIDYGKNVIRITKAKTAAAEAPEQPKTAAGTRVVKLLLPAKAALHAQRQYTILQNKTIFTNPKTGKPWTGDKQIRESYWRPALLDAGVRYRNPYQTRHTYASMMLSAGEPLAWVAHQMGHTSVLMTAKAYARWIPDADPAAGDKALALWSTQP